MEVCYISQKGQMQEWQRISGRVVTILDGEAIGSVSRFGRGLAKYAGWDRARSTASMATHDDTLWIGEALK